MTEEMCDGCGKYLDDEEMVWKSTYGQTMCCSCMFYPLDILKEVHDLLKAGKKKEAIDRIEEFDEECEASFLNPTEKEEPVGKKFTRLIKESGVEF